MAKKESTVLAPNDPFGVIRFEEIKKQFGDRFKIPKAYKNRFENIVSVFGYRTTVAQDLLRKQREAKESHVPYYELKEFEESAAKFKSAEFFCDALQALLDEKLKDEFKPNVRVAKPVDTGGWGMRR